MTPIELMRVYPQLDHLMAETLLLMDKQGKLATYLKTTTNVETTEEKLIGSITVTEAGGMTTVRK